MPMAHSSALAIARQSVRGALLLPDDDGFAQAAQPWNRAIEQTPAALAVPADLDDLRVLIAAARDDGLTVAVQPSGHGASGDLSGALVIRMSAFHDLALDLDAGIVRVGSGVPWGTVVTALEGTGWAAPAGTSPVVTVAGYTLGGGHSWFSRTAGLGSDNLRAAWVLRVDGRHERVDDESDPELLWALRGAGGIVGIVTALEIDLVRSPSIWGASFTFDASASGAVMRVVRDLAYDAPPELNVFVDSMRMPDAPVLPEELRGQSFITVQGLTTDGPSDRLLDAMRAVGSASRETTGPTSPATIAAASGEPTEPTPGRGASAALSSLEDSLIDELLAFRAQPEHWPIMGIGIRMLGGALVAPRRAGFAELREARWLLHALVPVFPGAAPEPADASIAEFDRVLSSALAPHTVPTFLGPGQTLELCGAPPAVDRLRAVRTALDPDGILHEGRLPR